MSVTDLVILVLLLSWMGGYSVHIGGNVIHLLLAAALIALVVRLVSGAGGGRKI